METPNHYGQCGFECLEILDGFFNDEELLGFILGNIFKYLWRYKSKNGKEDLQKAKHYYDFITKYNLSNEYRNHIMYNLIENKFANLDEE